jgi:hypothetical protein
MAHLEDHGPANDVRRQHSVWVTLPGSNMSENDTIPFPTE